MPAFSATAPGKIILFGEHSVVYGQPAIAVPLTQVRAKATVTPNIPGKPGVVLIGAPDVGVETSLAELPSDDPIGVAVRGVMAALGMKNLPSCTLKVTSTIPVAAGLGSGAAVSVAIIRSLAGFLGRPLSDETVSSLAFEVEKIHHGTPSGIDNTVVTYARPVYFIKDRLVETFQIAKPFTLLIADTGLRSPTKITVAEVRAAWQANPKKYEHLFATIGDLVKSARQLIEGGNPAGLGRLMDENHALLREMGVSSPELERLVLSAKKAGALGAKLSGGGRGGNMIALVTEALASPISKAMRSSGATHTLISQVGI
jgi:mevalonate kinase